RRTGLDEEAATRAVRAVAELLAAALDDAARDDLLAAVPGSIGLRVPSIRDGVTLEHIGLRVAYALGIASGWAVEIAEVVGQALFARVPEETRARARSLLDPSLGVLLAPPPSAAAPEATHATPVTGAGHTLASGRQGSHRPLAES